MAAVGERVTYTVTIENRGPVGAEDVVLGEAPEQGQAFASVRGRGRERLRASRRLPAQGRGVQRG